MLRASKLPKLSDAPKKATGDALFGQLFGPASFLGPAADLLGAAMGGTAMSSASSSAFTTTTMASPFIVTGGGGSTQAEVGATVRSVAPWAAVAVLAYLFMRRA